MKKNYIFLILSLSCLLFSAAFFIKTVRNPETIYMQAGSQEKRQNINTALELQQSFSYIAESITPLVVRIDVATNSGSGGFGSGIIVEQKENQVFVLTNNHVIDDAKKITVILSNDDSFEAQLLGKDKRTDIAVIKFESDSSFKGVKIGDSDEIKVGEWAVCIGNPYGFNGSLTIGVISALGRSALGRLHSGMNATDFIQHDAAINPGNSGGPLLNIKGEVIGINSWIASQTGSNTGLSFSVPINNAMAIYEQIVNNKKVEYAWIGVFLQSLNDQDFREKNEIEIDYGAYITRIVEDSPADEYGLLVGDVIIGIDDKTVKDSNELIWSITRYKPGDKVQLTILRESKKMNVDVVLAKRPKPNEVSIKEKTKDETKKKTKSSNFDFLGAYFSGVDNSVKKKYKLSTTKGVVVTDLLADSIAVKYGLKAGDLIYKINSTEIHSLDQLKDFKRKASKEKQEFFYFYLVRKGQEKLIGIRK